MKNVWYLIRLFLAALAVFMLQKVLFMVINLQCGADLGLGDWLSVVWHGLRLDMVMACYFITVPILVCLVAQFFNKFHLRAVMAVWFLLFSLVLAVAFLADAVLYSFWGAKLDVADFVYAKNPKDMLASLSGWMVVLAFAGVAMLAVLQFLLFFKVTPKQSDRVRNKWLYSLMMLVLMGLTCVGLRGGVTESTANPSYAYFSNNQYLNHAALNPLFNIIHSSFKGEDLAKEFDFYDDKKLAEVRAEVFASGDDVADSLLTTQRPNILLLIWEGGGSLFLENDEVAPGFGRLRKEGVYFSNMYANNFRTDRGLVSILNGWPGLPTTSVMKMSGKCKSLPSLAKVLRGEGYHSVFCYGGDIDFTNMRGYLYETGYDKVLGGEHYEWAPVDSKWGVDDEYLLQNAKEQLPEGRFFATFLTLSSHEPWQVPYHRLEDEKSNSFAYTDSCIYRFVKDLKASPLWDNLLLIIVPDHGVAWKDHGPSDVAVAKIPMLWLGGAVRGNDEVDRLMNQSDIVATLLRQMGIGTKDFVFSRNALSSQCPPTMVTHAYKNGLNFIDSCGSARYGIVDGQVMLSGKEHSKFTKVFAQGYLQDVYTETGRL